MSAPTVDDTIGRLTAAWNAGDATAYAAEAIGAMRVMQAFGMERATADRFAEANDEAFEAARISTRARAALTGTAIFLVSASVVGNASQRRMTHR